MKDIKDLKLIELKKVRELQTDEINKELKSACKKYFTLKMKLNLWELKQTHLILVLRRYIARLKTVLNSKNNIS